MGWKYKHALLHHGGDSLLRILRNVEDDTYYARKYRLLNDDWTGIMGQEQCWSLLNHVLESIQLCISVDDENTIQFSVHQDAVTVVQESLRWNRDDEWNEITKYFSGDTEKCVLYINMRICIRCADTGISRELPIQQISVLVDRGIDGDEDFG